MAASLGSHSSFSWLLRLLTAFALLYLFLVGINVLETAIKTATMSGASQVKEALEAKDINPIVALSIGVLITVMVQSSSATTSMIVAAVGAGALPLTAAIPMVMGANIGTSVTSTLVSLGHVTRSEEFRRAYAGATVHDAFNLLTVAIMLPIELITAWMFNGRGVLNRAASWLVNFLPHDQTGEKPKSWFKNSIKWLGEHISHFFSDVLGLSGGWLSVALFICALLMLLLSLALLTKTMRMLMADRIEQWLNRVLEKSIYLGLIVGIGITTMVQSSSITTSLLVPMFGGGILTLEAGFPILVGANIGTTVTAIIASLVVTGNKEAAMTIAMVHLLFNCCGTLMFLPVRRLRLIPIGCAQWLADHAVRNKLWVLGYLMFVFVLLPLVGWLCWR